MGGDRSGRLLGTLLALVVLASCFTGGSPAAPASAAPAALSPASAGTAQSGARPGRFVIAISVDGLTPWSIRALGRAGTPALHRMIRTGASTLNARSAHEVTKTLPNHTGMLTGRRPRGPQGHHIMVNEDPGTTVEKEAGRYRVSLFDVVHDRGGSTALFAGKDKFQLFDRSWGSRHGRPDPVGADDGRDKIDHFVLASSDRLVSRLVRRLEEGRPFRAAFLHLALPDVAGHEHGYRSAAYLEAVRRSDRLVGRILNAVARRPALRRGGTVLLTADHGGAKGARDHADATLRANYTIPFLAWGAGVARRADLYALNPGRVNPGTGRPAYGRRPPVRNTDVANLVTRLLGYPRVPGARLPHTRVLRVS